MRFLGTGALAPLPSRAGIRKLVLVRRARELRRLEQVMPSTGVWANRQ